MSDWTFNLRTNRIHDSDDDVEDNEDNAYTMSDDKHIDISTRHETVNYKPTPWTIAKINAASRLPPPPRSAAPEKKQGVTSRPIHEAFKTQAAKARRNETTTPGLVAPTFAQTPGRSEPQAPSSTSRTCSWPSTHSPTASPAFQENNMHAHTFVYECPSASSTETSNIAHASALDISHASALDIQAPASSNREHVHLSDFSTQHFSQAELQVASASQDSSREIQLGPATCHRPSRSSPPSFRPALGENDADKTCYPFPIQSTNRFLIFSPFLASPHSGLSVQTKLCRNDLSAPAGASTSSQTPKARTKLFLDRHSNIPASAFPHSSPARPCSRTPTLAFPCSALLLQSPEPLAASRSPPLRIDPASARTRCHTPMHVTYAPVAAPAAFVSAVPAVHPSFDLTKSTDAGPCDSTSDISSHFEAIPHARPALDPPMSRQIRSNPIPRSSRAYPADEQPHRSSSQTASPQYLHSHRLPIPPTRAFNPPLPIRTHAPPQLNGPVEEEESPMPGWLSSTLEFRASDAGRSSTAERSRKRTREKTLPNSPSQPTRTRPAPRFAIKPLTKRDGAVFDNDDPDAQWSTLPSRTKSKGRVKTSGTFRLPITIPVQLSDRAGKAKSGVNEHKVTRAVVTYRPPPLPPSPTIEVKTHEYLLSSPSLRPSDSEHDVDGCRSSSPPTSDALCAGHTDEPILPINLDDMRRRYPQTRVLITKRRRLASELWDVLGLESCGAVWRDNSASAGREIGIVRWGPK